MKKQTLTKIISTVILFNFVMFFLTPLITSVTFAADELNWENPNKNGDNPYKISTDAILNSQTLMQVVGCTGLVDKVSGAVTGFLSKAATNALTKIFKTKAKEKAKIASCTAVKKGLNLSFANIDAAGTNYTPAYIESIDCNKLLNMTDEDALIQAQQAADAQKATETREACFNGLAYTLAKNQLTSMTRQTVSWVNSGLGGNPLYVQNMRSLTNSIERNVIETGINVLTNKAFPEKAYPYGTDFSKTIINSYNSGIMNGAENFLDSMTSDLALFFTDDASYFNTTDTRNATERARSDNMRFANDFSVGGWNGYLALTQRDNNNPLGFAMQTSQYLADRITQQANETKSEVTQNNGFLSQKTCIKWWWWDSVNTPTKGRKINNNNDVLGLPPSYEPVYSENKSTKVPNFDKCMDWKVTTPGSIIKDKLTTYINSPERQLELADTINKSLNSLFTQLIENFRSEGLFGLSQERYSAVDDMIGYGVNGTGVDGEIGQSDGSSPIYSAGYNGEEGFDLTRDLGNIYTHEKTRSLGTWNANSNQAKSNTGVALGQLNVDLGVYNKINDAYEDPNYYFTVSDSGNTKLYSNGYTGWAKGDRAFWDGTKWQNWKKNQTSPILKRGIVQTQMDYVIAAEEILKILPSVMPKMGELDYCIPGPNPYFEIESGTTGAAFNTFANSLSSTYKEGSFLARDTSTFTIAQPGQVDYDEYRSIFNGSGTLWGKITETGIWKAIQELGKMGKVPSDDKEKIIQNQIDKKLQEIAQDIKTFYTEYNTKVFEGIYGTMRKETLENELTLDETKNPAYLPMVEDGYSMTKGMSATSEEIDIAGEDYRDAIVTAKLNAAKLNTIMVEVSNIIKAAQARRDNDPKFQEKIKEYFETTDLATAKSRYAQFKIDNPTCFREEDISYYSSNDIIVNNGSESGRCRDNLDNDLDGLIDSKDPDCKVPPPTTTTNTNTGEVIPTVSLHGCMVDEKREAIPYDNTKQLSTSYCLNRTKERCTADGISYDGSRGYTCKFVEGAGTITNTGGVGIGTTSPTID